MAVSFREWNFILVDYDTGQGIVDNTGLLQVLAAGSPSAPTALYSDDKGTSQTNLLTTPANIPTPFTFANGRVRFWTDRATTTVDLIVTTAKGQAYFITGVPYSRHRIPVSDRERDHMLVVPFGSTNAVEQTSGLALPINVVLKDVMLRVTALHAGKTILAGRLSTESGGSANSLFLGASTATVGFVNLWPTVTNGTNIDFHDATASYGADLEQSIVGADAVATVGGFERRYKITDGVSKTISYTPSSGSTTAAGYIYIQFTRLV